MELVPISLKEANAFVERYHRHHKPVVGHKFSVAVAVDGEIVGVACWRCAKNMGYKKLITYILDTENGASLKASGWKCVGEAGGKRWTGVRRPEVDLYPAQMKLRFEIM